MKTVGARPSVIGASEISNMGDRKRPTQTGIPVWAALSIALLPLLIFWSLYFGGH